MFSEGGVPLWQNVALGFLGLSAGGIIAAGVFAFLAIIGVFPRFMKFPLDLGGILFLGFLVWRLDCLWDVL